VYQTLLEARNGTLINVAGACSNSPEFRALLNEATSRLLRRGDWADTVVPIHVCVRRGCVVWPRYVGQVRKMNLCTTNLPIQNMWWSFMPQENYRMWCGSECQMIGSGKSPVYSDIYGDSRYVAAFPTVKEDVGKTVTLFGIDNGNQPLRHKDSSGSWKEGIVITLAEPYAATTCYVRRIDRVILDVMQADVLLYAYNTTNSMFEDLARYQPGETNPEYVRYSLNIACCTDNQSVNALVKLRFIPVRFDTDLVLINNLDALKDMMSSIKFREAGDTQDANYMEASAIRELNLQQRNEFPDSQIPINVGAFGGLPVYQRVW